MLEVDKINLLASWAGFGLNVVMGVKLRIGYPFHCQVRCAATLRLLQVCGHTSRQVLGRQGEFPGP